MLAEKIPGKHGYVLPPLSQRRQMRLLSSDLREFIHLLNTTRVKYVIVGARSIAVLRRLPCH
jgi:hypothetical protein